MGSTSPFRKPPIRELASATASALRAFTMKSVAASCPAAGCGVGEDDEVVHAAVGSGLSGEPGGVDPHHLEALPVDLEGLAHRIGGAEEESLPPGQPMTHTWL